MTSAQETMTAKVLGAVRSAGYDKADTTTLLGDAHVRLFGRGCEAVRVSREGHISRMSLTQLDVATRGRVLHALVGAGLIT